MMSDTVAPHHLDGKGLAMLVLLLITLPICIEIAAWAGEDVLQTRLLGTGAWSDCEALDLSQSDTAISL
jgi:hypothetical protein